MKCKYCTGSMVKKGTLDSGNVKSALFLLWGIGSFGMLSCPDCQAVIYGKKGK